MRHCCILFFVTLGLLLSCQVREEAGEDKLNVILVSFDDLRPELGCYGNQEIRTPNLDRFAESGLVFLNNYCQVAVCQPSRASYLTGLRPDSVGSWHLGDHHRGLHSDIVTLPQYFHRSGYHTVSIGKIFHNHVPDSVFFDEPDLRPAKYKTAKMIDRDAESFYVDDRLNAELAVVRQKRLAANPDKYAGGWAYGRSFECTDAPDTAFYDGAQTDLALETLRRLKDRDQPFFLALGYFRPHLPFVAPQKYWDLYHRDSIPPASNPFLPVDAPLFAMNSTYELGACYDLEDVWKHPSEGLLPDSIARILKHGYYASVSYVDACFGKLMDGIRKMGLADNSVVVVLGDHGWKLGEHGSWCKQTNYEIDTRVPLIICAPGMAGKGLRTERLTELVDVFPTLCELCELEVPEYLQGTSVVPLMEDPDRGWKSAIFSQYHRRPKVTPDGKRYMGYGMKTEKYHYIEWYYWDNERHEAEDYVACELYDHLKDPEENLNISGRPENKELVGKLSVRLKEGWKAAIPKPSPVQ